LLRAVQAQHEVGDIELVPLGLAVTQRDELGGSTGSERSREPRQHDALLARVVAEATGSTVASLEREVGSAVADGETLSKRAA